MVYVQAAAVQRRKPLELQAPQAHAATNNNKSTTTTNNIETYPIDIETGDRDHDEEEPNKESRLLRFWRGPSQYHPFTTTRFCHPRRAAGRAALAAHRRDVVCGGYQTKATKRQHQQIGGSGGGAGSGGR